MPIYLLDDSLSVNIYYDQSDCEYEDSICISILEDCPESEKVFKAGESNLYVTREQARLLAAALLFAADENCLALEEGGE